MATILTLPHRTNQCYTQVEVLSRRAEAQILVSYRIVEHEVIPLLAQIVASLERASDDAASNAEALGLPDGTTESVESAAELARKVQRLAESFRDILVPEALGAGDRS
jgi:hypothetical protein